MDADELSATQGDPTMNPDRISEYSRGERQQEVFYNTQAWQASLEGKGAPRLCVFGRCSADSLGSGIKRAGEEAEGGKRKKVTAKDVVSVQLASGACVATRS